MTKLEIILIIITVITLAILIMGFLRRCPSCAKWWSRKNINSEIINERLEYETVTRYDVHRNSQGKEIGRTERKEQIRVKYTDYLNHHYCKNCSVKWDTNSYKRREL